MTLSSHKRLRRVLQSEIASSLSRCCWKTSRMGCSQWSTRPRRAVDGRPHSTTPAVPYHNDVFHFQHVDCELQHREVVCILRRSEFSDISVYVPANGIVGLDPGELFRVS